MAGVKWCCINVYAYCALPLYLLFVPIENQLFFPAQGFLAKQEHVFAIFCSASEQVVIRSFPVSSLFKTKLFSVHDMPHVTGIDPNLQVSRLASTTVLVSCIICPVEANLFDICLSVWLFLYEMLTTLEQVRDHLRKAPTSREARDKPFSSPRKRKKRMLHVYSSCCVDDRLIDTKWIKSW